MTKRQTKKCLSIIANNEESRSTIRKALKGYKILFGLSNKEFREAVSHSESRIKLIMDIKERYKDSLEGTPFTDLLQAISTFELGQSRLKNLPINSRIKNNLKKVELISNENMLLLFTLVESNLNIFEHDIKGKNLNISFFDGLHSGITEKLEIRDDQMPHLLGLTPDKGESSNDTPTIEGIYTWYRKYSLLNDIYILKTYPDYKKKFYDEYGIEYSDENIRKIVSCNRYISLDSGEIDTEEKKKERELNNKLYGFYPRSDLYSFFRNNQSIEAILDENKEVNKFAIKYYINYLRTHKVDLKEKDEDLLRINFIENKVIDKYLSHVNKRMIEFKIFDSKDFKESFKDKFMYNFPLVYMNHLLTKNISFYNFSNFENINKVLVDYSRPKEKTGAGLYLLSYNDRINVEENGVVVSKDILDYYEELIKKEMDKALKESQMDPSIVESRDENGNAKKHDYQVLMKSIDKFPSRLRYWFEKTTRDGIEIVRDFRDNIRSGISKNAIFSSVGFIRKNGDTGGFIRKYNCNTNKTFNYDDYDNDLLKFGFVLDVPIIDNDTDILGIPTFADNLLKELDIIGDKPMLDISDYERLLDGLKVINELEKLSKLKPLERKEEQEKKSDTYIIKDYYKAKRTKEENVLLNKITYILKKNGISGNLGYDNEDTLGKGRHR